MRVENASPRSSCTPSPRATSSPRGGTFAGELMKAVYPTSESSEAIKKNSCDDTSSIDSLIVGQSLNHQFTPRTSKAEDFLSSNCLTTIQPEKVVGVSPVNLPLSFNIPVKIEDAPAEDREAAHALVCLGDSKESSPQMTLGQKRGFAELSVNTSFGGMDSAALGLKKRRAVAAARKISVKLYSAATPLASSGASSETFCEAVPTPSFRRTLSVLAETAIEFCGEQLTPAASSSRHDNRRAMAEMEMAICMELCKNN